MWFLQAYYGLCGTKINNNNFECFLVVQAFCEGHQYEYSKNGVQLN